MKILIINPNNILDRILGSGKIFAKPDIPLGLFYIVAYLRLHHFQVILRDSYLLNDSHENVLAFLREYRPNIVGISCLTANGKWVYGLGRLIKKAFPNMMVVLGNLHASVFSDFFLRQNATDAVVHGEGEITFLELCRAVDSKKSMDTVRGISWKDGNKIIHNPKRELIRNLDDLPFPYLEDVNYSAYRNLKANKKPYMKIITSRGCINKCTFCAVHSNKEYRTRSIDNVIEEIEFYIQRYKVKRFSFEDPLFIAKPRRVIDFCEQLQKRQLDINWACEGHINCLSEPLLKKMAEAGCFSMAIGIESGNQAILNSINKKTTLVEVESKVDLASRYIKHLTGMFIIGLPGETEQTINETINLALRLPIMNAQFSMFTPYPGTESYHALIQEGRIEVNEDDPDQLVDSWDRYSSYAIFADQAPVPIFIPEHLTLNKLKKLHRSALRKFFFRLKNLRLVLEKPSHLGMLECKDALPFLHSVVRLFNA